MKPLLLLCVLGLAALNFQAAAQVSSQPLAEAVQIGTRIVRSPGADALQLRLIIPPNLMIYSGSKLVVKFSLPSTRQFAEPAPSRVQMVDGTIHLVHAGPVTLNALFPLGSLPCGRSYHGSLLVQGCTKTICYAPESIPFQALSSAC
jgi:hypothetical protein